MMEIKHKKEGETSETHQQSILSHSLEKPGFADCKENMIQGKIPADFHFAFRCSDSFVVVIMQVQINDDFCGMDVNTPLGGSMPIEATPVLTYSGLLLTSVAATSTHDYTVAFMGTATGHLKKDKNFILWKIPITSSFLYADKTPQWKKWINDNAVVEAQS
ncbi:plexin-A4-like protein [Caerostris extrusa]|uniref:Plexin-A4-like protein n=1 Tax=Caerostris extrusa TaxID=172846 RepID=A0AAV4XAB2_CAEEX|nr:plexin-A4-like protein [Caerostris extrusa]